MDSRKKKRDFSTTDSDDEFSDYLYAYAEMLEKELKDKCPDLNMTSEEIERWWEKFCERIRLLEGKDNDSGSEKD